MDKIFPSKGPVLSEVCYLEYILAPTVCLTYTLDKQFCVAPYASYGEESYDKLRNLHHALDPKDFFTSRQKGWFFKAGDSPESIYPS